MTHPSERPLDRRTTTPETTPLGPEPGRGARVRLVAAVVSLLTLHVALAVHSLLQENPTVDEVLHLPAGVSYWQKGTFKLYHHNPPLVKLIAALPVVLGRPSMTGLYESEAWLAENQLGFGHLFAYANVKDYFELFDRARLMMPLFTVVGGLVVFAWSSRLYGPGGGLLSQTLWCLCPNILAHGRLVTTDAAATAIGVGATYWFWRYQKNPTWTRAGLAGVALGLAQLTKFSSVLLYGLWPMLAAVRWLLERPGAARPTRWAKGLGRWAA